MEKQFCVLCSMRCPSIFPSLQFNVYFRVTHLSKEIFFFLVGEYIIKTGIRKEVKVYMII